MNGQRLLVRVLIVGLLLVPMIGSGPFPARAADFDKDGYADLAIGVALDEVSGQLAVGAVNVLYGTSAGIAAANDQLWTENDLGELSWFNEYFGSDLAAGDFDGNGAADLAVGAPGESIAVSQEGAVFVLYGSSPEGLVSTGNQFWHQGSPGVPAAAEEDDWFGDVLAVGDFDGDGYDDLAVGVPAEDIGTTSDAGAVNVLYGSAEGLTSLGAEFWREGYNGLPGDPEALDQFGLALAAGDFDHDGHDDLAISIPNQDIGSIDSAGRVVILYGTADGLTATGSQTWQQGLRGLGDESEDLDRFGSSLVTGDYNGDGYADLAIGVPNEELVLQEGAGRVQVLYGSGDGLTSAGNKSYCLESYAEDELYGDALAAGDFNGDGFDELAVGIPAEDLYTWSNIGAVEILYGSSGGLYRRSGRDDFWTQGDADMEDGPEMGDRFGSVLAAGDFDHDSYVDLAVGIVGEDVGLTVSAGAVHILYGSADGIAVTGNQFWNQDSPSVEGVAGGHDYFGFALAAIPLSPSIPPPPPAQWEKIFLPLIENGD